MLRDEPEYELIVIDFIDESWGLYPDDDDCSLDPVDEVALANERNGLTYPQAVRAVAELLQELVAERLARSVIPEAVAACEALLKDPVTNIETAREIAYHAFGWRPRDIEGCYSSPEELPQRVVHFSKHLASREYLSILVAYLQGNTFEKTVAALYLLRTSDYSSTSAMAAIPQILVRFVDESSCVRKAAGFTALCWHNRGAPVLQNLLRALKVPHWQMLRMAALVLAEIGSDARQAASRLIELLELLNAGKAYNGPEIPKQRDYSGFERSTPETLHASFQTAVIYAIDRIGPTDDSFDALATALRIGLKRQDPDLIISAMNALAHFRTRSCAVLSEVLVSGRSAMRIACAELLDVSGSNSTVALPGLIECLRISDVPLGLAALNVLRRFKMKGKRFVAALRTVIQNRVDPLLEPALALLLEEARNEAKKRRRNRCDELLLRWFDSLDFEKWREKLQVFWCIGKVDHAGLMAVGHAKGPRALASRLRRMKAEKRLSEISCSENYIRGLLEELSSVFNTAPFRHEAWSSDESCPDLQVTRLNGERMELDWSPRARAAWKYVDRYLALKQAKPLFIWR